MNTFAARTSADTLTGKGQITMPGPPKNELSNLANTVTCIDFSIADCER